MDLLCVLLFFFKCSCTYISYGMLMLTKCIIAIVNSIFCYKNILLLLLLCFTDRKASQHRTSHIHYCVSIRIFKNHQHMTELILKDISIGSKFSRELRKRIKIVNKRYQMSVLETGRWWTGCITIYMLFAVTSKFPEQQEKASE